MDVNTRNRADLKVFFVKNSIPTQSNFADLIDGMLNQKDDGFVKAKNLPLSIEAADPGVADSEKKAITIYQSFADPNPAWTLSLNPRTTPNDPKTAKLGFSISDGEGTNRLFIDRSSGNVGIGTMTPEKRLHIEAGELRVRANHNNATADIGTFVAQDLTQGIGIGYDRIQAIGSAAAQNIQIIAKGAAGVFLKPGGDRYVVMQADGNLVIYDGVGTALWASGTSISDVRVKENIHAINNALTKVLQLRGVSFSWKDKTMGGNEEIGLVAQEVETVMPYLVHSVDQKTKMIRYEKCVPLLVEAIKEQQASIEQLRSEIQLSKA